MIACRLTQAAYAAALQGTGAFYAGGRWNTKGSSILYCAASRSLALCEVLVHLPKLELHQRSFAFSVIEFPEDSFVSAPPLPPDWHQYPYSPAAQAIGDGFLQQAKHLALRVPSALVPSEWIFGLNPNHRRNREIRLLSVEPFVLDHRFFQRP